MRNTLLHSIYSCQKQIRIIVLYKNMLLIILLFIYTIVIWKNKSKQLNLLNPSASLFPETFVEKYQLLHQQHWGQISFVFIMCIQNIYSLLTYLANLVICVKKTHGRQKNKKKIA
jgi:uncharacterized membrane protein YhaH (DUF805 family)